jgi:hypothetical protein
MDERIEGSFEELGSCSAGYVGVYATRASESSSAHGHRGHVILAMADAQDEVLSRVFCSKDARELVTVLDRATRIVEDLDQAAG